MTQGQIRSKKVMVGKAIFPAMLFFIGLAGLVLRLAAINDPITYDEAYTYIAFVAQPIFTVISDYSLPNNHILHSMLAHFSVQIFGNHLWSLRLPALLAGMGMIWATYAFGTRIYNRNVGLLAAALVAFWPEAIRHTTDARGYSLVSLFTLLILLLGERVLRKKDWRFWLGIAIFSALGLWTIPLMLFPFGIVFVWLFLEALFKDYSSEYGSRWKFLLRWLATGFGAAALTFVLYLPAIRVSGLSQLMGNGFVTPIPADEYVGLLRDRLLATAQTWTAEVPVIVVIILLLGFLLGLLFHWRVTNLCVPIQIAATLWLVTYIILRRPDAFPRFWSFLLAPVLIFSAAGLLGWRKQAQSPAWMRWTKAGVMIGALGLLAIQAAVALPSIPSRWGKISNAQAAAEFLDRRIQPGDMILAGYPHNAPVWYYLDALGVSHEYWMARTEFEQVYLLLAGNQEGQTLEKVVLSYKLDIADFDLEQATELQTYGNIKIFLCSPAQH